MAILERSNQYGTVFGNWQIDKLLGQGRGGNEGKTAVFQLKRTSSLGIAEICAMKVINLMEEHIAFKNLSVWNQKEMEGALEECIENAKKEVLCMIQIGDAPNIVTYFDHALTNWESGNRFGIDLLIRMKKMDESLDNIERMTQEYDEALVYSVGKAICQALCVCHSKNIIHRDIKPGNIFRDEEGIFRLGDFGISRILLPQQKANTTAGTKAYVAPEQISYNGNYDERVDIYSLGLTLYELSNMHRLPFARNAYYLDESALIKRLNGETLPVPCEASPHLAEVILKACACNPSERFQTAREFLTALEAAEHNCLHEGRTPKDVNGQSYEMAQEQNDDDDPFATMAAKPDYVQAEALSDMPQPDELKETEVSMSETIPQEYQQTDMQTKPVNRPAEKYTETKDHKLKISRKSVLLLATAGVAVACAIIMGIYYQRTVKDSNNSAQIPKDAEEFNGHSYYVFLDPDMQTWGEAETYCESLGGHLATITSKEENDFVWQFMRDSKFYDAYFGLSDKNEEGKWEWVTGEQVEFTNWHEGEPNNGAGAAEENYAMFYHNYEDEWNDWDFGEIKSFICEWE